MRKENAPVYTLKADAGPTQKGLMRFQIEVCINFISFIFYYNICNKYKTDDTDRMMPK